MGTGYTRNDTSNNIANGNVIDADDLDGEFNAIESAFNESTGHTHDGTSAEGAPIEVTGPNQEYLSDATALYPKTDDTYDLGKTGAEWKDLYIDGTANVDSLVADAGTVGGSDIVTTDNTKTLTNKTIDSASNTLTVDLTEATVTGTLAEFNTALSDGNFVSIAGSETLTNKTLTSPDINGGTIDNTVIGGTTPAAISGTTGTFSDDLAVDTNTLFVDASTNRVGIGTSSPTIQLDQLGDSLMHRIRSTTSTSAYARYQGTSGIMVVGILGGLGYVGTTDASDLRLLTNNSEAMRIDNTGDVGIGTSNPTHLLTVGEDGGSNPGEISLGRGGVESASIYWTRVGTNDAEITYTADEDLVIKNAFSGGAVEYTNNNGNHIFNTGASGSTEAMRIDSSGNVGIGTSTPAHQFEVENSTGGAIIAATSSTSGTSQIRMGDTANTGAGRIEYDNSANAMSLHTAGNERVTITSAGDVGIGTSTPGSKLSVVGLPTSSAGLSAGDIWNDSGTLKIVT